MHVSAGESGADEPLSDINTTPLIDVMLVLLIMLIITIPIQLHAVDLNLPKAQPAKPQDPPEVVSVDITAGGQIQWNGEPLADVAALDTRLRDAAAAPIAPEFHLRADGRAHYRAVAAVMAAIQRRGLRKVGLVGNEQFE
jgi:biopolymer transport protein ExbD